MGELVGDPGTDRSFYLDYPDGLETGEKVVFILNLHGGGSSGQWQHGYFPAHQLKDEFRLVIAAPTAATAEPSRRWVAEADDQHLQNVVDLVIGRFGQENIASFRSLGLATIGSPEAGESGCGRATATGKVSRMLSG